MIFIKILNMRSVWEEERERKRKRNGILFLGLLVWHLETGEIPGRRRKGNVLNRREIKKKKGREGKKKPILFPTEWSGPLREIN